MLDPMTALIVVDLQTGVVGPPLVRPIGEVVARIRALADAFRQRDLSAALVDVDGGAPGRTEQPRQTAPLAEGRADLIPELNRQPDDIVVTKRTRGAFAGADLEAQLKARGVTQAAVAGGGAATGAESTARQANEHGFNVTLAVDAMADRRLEARDCSVTQAFPRLGETGTTKRIIDRLAGMVFGTAR
jgi:nicotinamidase-related amidase